MKWRIVRCCCCCSCRNNLNWPQIFVQHAIEEKHLDVRRRRKVAMRALTHQLAKKKKEKKYGETMQTWKSRGDTMGFSKAVRFLRAVIVSPPRYLSPIYQEGLQSAPSWKCSKFCCRQYPPPHCYSSGRRATKVVFSITAVTLAFN